jgi:hypothetical protein
MKYRIKINYRTGNSFGTYDEEAFIEYEWESLSMAKESLKCIKNHNEFYRDNSNLYTKPMTQLPPGVSWDEEFRIIVLELVDDEGKNFRYSSFWTGYFEELSCVEVVCSEDTDMVYNVNSF